MTTTALHGTNTRYQTGCRCTGCRAAHAASQGAWKQRRIDGRTTVPVLGARRRVQALMTLGWPRRELARQLGHACDSMSGVLSVHDRIEVATHRRINDLYDRLCMTPGPSADSRRLAKAKGWPPPLAWDDIDDPDEQPDIGSPGRDDLIDPVVVERILNLDVVPATPAERLAVIDRWRELGRPLNTLDDFTGWNVRRDLRRTAHHPEGAALCPS